MNTERIKNGDMFESKDEVALALFLDDRYILLFDKEDTLDIEVDKNNLYYTVGSYRQDFLNFVGGDYLGNILEDV